jgi:membrane-associated protein
MRSRLVSTARILSTLLLVSVASTAFAAGGATEPVENFWQSLVRVILAFDADGLKNLLGQPMFAVPALIAVNLIVFTETGLLLGFFLPGDSLLVTVGLIAADPACNWNLPVMLVTVSLSAILGDTVGYSIGYKTGPMIFNREKSLFFNKEHLLAAQAFYEKHGGKTIILARFMPILRTFAPVVAGVGRMSYWKFLAFNVVGGISWVVSMILIGYFLPTVLNGPLSAWSGQEIHVEKHVEKIVILVVLVSIAPGILMWLRSRFVKPQQVAA